MAANAALPSATGALVLVLVAGWIACQAWLLGARWINPDEGAHLMDVRLAMDGLVPFVDYGARQPLYVYAYVPFLKYFGGGYISGRLMPLSATLLTAWLLWAIGQRLAGRAAGISAALWYLFTPTVLINATVAKTEPLAALLVALAIYAIVVHMDRTSWWLMALAGVALGAGYYVRESTLGGLLAAGIMVLARGPEGWGRALRRLGLLAAGYAAVCAAVIAFYSRHLPMGSILASSALSPLSRVLNSVRKIAAWWMPDAESAVGPWSVGSFEVSQSAEAIRRNLHEVLSLNAPLLIGAAIAMLLLAWAGLRRSRRGAGTGERWGLVVPLGWLASMALVYAYHIATRGFYQFYFRELIPPLALLLALALQRCAPERAPGAWLVGVTVAGIAAGLGVCLMQRYWHGSGAMYALGMVGAAGYLAFSPVLSRGLCIRVLGGYLSFVALVVAVRWTPLGGSARHAPAVWVATGGLLVLLALVRAMHRRLPAAAVGRFVGLGALGAALMMSATASARVLSLAYDCVWSPGTVRSVAQLVRAHSAEGETALSGAVIWEFAAGRRPFMNLSHPLAYMYTMPPEMRQRITDTLASKPPRIVVLDGYTERTHLQHLPQLRTLLATGYEAVGEVAGSRYPVRVYALREQAR